MSTRPGQIVKMCESYERIKTHEMYIHFLEPFISSEMLHSDISAIDGTNNGLLIYYVIVAWHVRHNMQ